MKDTLKRQMESAESSENAECNKKDSRIENDGTDGLAISLVLDVDIGTAFVSDGAHLGTVERNQRGVVY